MMNDISHEDIQKTNLQSQTTYAYNAKPIYNVLKNEGDPLDEKARIFMESRFDRDFSHVRIHTDTKAAESAKSINALAYSVGKDIVFDKGQYAPETHSGKLLIAHELAHVLQQTPGFLDNKSILEQKISNPNDSSELESRNIAEEIMDNRYAESFIERSTIMENRPISDNRIHRIIGPVAGAIATGVGLASDVQSLTAGSMSLDSNAWNGISQIGEHIDPLGNREESKSIQIGKVFRYVPFVENFNIIYKVSYSFKNGIMNAEVRPTQSSSASSRDSGKVSIIDKTQGWENPDPFGVRLPNISFKIYATCDPFLGRKWWQYWDVTIYANKGIFIIEHGKTYGGEVNEENKVPVVGQDVETGEKIPVKEEKKPTPVVSPSNIP
jgi:hypothetical protein